MPSQTIGPSVAIGLLWDEGPRAVPDSTEGELRIAGTVYDGSGAPIYDSRIATWEADPRGAEAASTMAPGA